MARKENILLLLMTDNNSTDDTDGLKQLKRTNKVFTKNNLMYIEINKSDDFIYDLDGLYVTYDDKLNFKEVVGNVPENILANINGFNTYELLDFVRFVEKNLIAFCSGQIPEETIQDKQSKQNKEETKVFNTNIDTDRELTSLPENYKFSINPSVTGNLKMDLYKENILIFTCEVLNAHVTCNRCTTVNTLESCAESKHFCKKCSSTIGFNYIPTFNSDYIGLLQLKNCSLVMVDRCNYQINCEKCGKNYLTKKMAQKQKFDSKCFHCYTPLRFSVGRLYLITQKKVQIKEGEELPNKGTCKHYGKSYRWFRFSCCNSLYPCDVCHDEETNHKSELANRMVCGFCSKEQSVKKDCECGMTMRKKHSQFWEGGKGNRNKDTLNRKDSRKNKR